MYLVDKDKYLPAFIYFFLSSHPILKRQTPLLPHINTNRYHDAFTCHPDRSLVCNQYCTRRSANSGCCIPTSEYPKRSLNYSTGTRDAGSPAASLSTVQRSFHCRDLRASLSGSSLPVHKRKARDRIPHFRPRSFYCHRIRAY